MKIRARFRAVTLCVLILVMMLPTRAFAAQSIDPAKSTSLTMSYRDGDDPIMSARFDLHFVAERNANGEYVMNGDFKNISVELEDMDSDGMLALAATLTAYIGYMDIQPLASGVTDSEGVLEFGGLKAGLYLVQGYTHEQDGYTYTSTPFLAYLPAYDEANDQWIYDLAVFPKHESAPDTPNDETVDRKVIKVWNDGGDESERPGHIVVHLLRNGDIYDTVMLSAENNWRHTWTELDNDYTWTVVEVVPKGYTVTITKEGITFVITNSKPNDTPPPDNSTSPPTLPQTGQLWWPVPLLAAAGIILFLIGYIRNRGAFDET